MESCEINMDIYYTGSKAEGIDLPGSDFDFMMDINETINIRVVQTIQDTQDSSSQSILSLHTENVPSGFAMLRWQPNSRHLHPLLLRASRDIHGALYLSSFLFMHGCQHAITPEDGTSMTIQGPSLEKWSEYCDKSESGTDHVPSIHCQFWPSGAGEWVHRPRYYGWPEAIVRANIIDFGCHLVPIGNPLSPSKDMQWRVSFSVAERTLVWSFNHVQAQCYAVMKILLKEYINVRCSPQNRILCSYFIKTFLFWTFEDTAETFWCAENFRACVSFLLIEFSKCIRDGVLRHYFFPGFNLLSIKLTREAQRELLQLLETAIQCDISILKECRTMRKVWSAFMITDDNRNDAISKITKLNVLRNDECMMVHVNRFYKLSADQPQGTIAKFIALVLTLFSSERRWFPLYSHIANLGFLIRFTKSQEIGMYTNYSDLLTVTVKDHPSIYLHVDFGTPWY